MYHGKSGAIQGMGVAPFLHLDDVVNENGAFGSSSTTVANFTFTYD